MTTASKSAALSAAVVVVFSLTSCGGEEAEGNVAAGVKVTSTDLGEIVLPVNEAPEEVDYIAERSGSVSLEDLWPSDCCPSQQIAFEDAGFSEAYARVFQKAGHSDDPIDTRPGWEIVSSAAVLFRTAQGASEAMDAWIGYYESPALEALPADDLGQEAIAVTGSPNAPAEVFFLYLWRVDRALMSLRVSAGADTVTVEDVRALVDRMNSQIS